MKNVWQIIQNKCGNEVINVINWHFSRQKIDVIPPHIDEVSDVETFVIDNIREDYENTHNN